VFPSWPSDDKASGTSSVSPQDIVGRLAAPLGQAKWPRNPARRRMVEERRDSNVLAQKSPRPRTAEIVGSCRRGQLITDKALRKGKPMPNRRHPKALTSATCGLLHVRVQCDPAQILLAQRSPCEKESGQQKTPHPRRGFRNTPSPSSSTAKPVQRLGQSTALGVGDVSPRMRRELRIQRR